MANKIERKYLAHFIDASFGTGSATPKYVRLGADLEEYNLDLNPDIEVMVRARNNDEALQLEKTGITGVFNDKEAAAESLAGAIYAHYAPKTEDE